MKTFLFICVFVILIEILIIMPTGFEKQMYVNSEGVRGKVMAVDNTSMYKTGMITQGEQNTVIEILSGRNHYFMQDLCH